MKHLKEAETAIDGIERLGLSADNPRFLWVDRLNRDWALVASFKKIRQPGELLPVYQSCYNPQLPSASMVLNRGAPYLPRSCTDVFAFYAEDMARAEQTAEELTRAVALYSKLTDGGGAGVDMLFRAGLLLRRGEREQARAMTVQAKAACGAWARTFTQTLLRQMDNEEDAI